MGTIQAEQDISEQIRAIQAGLRRSGRQMVLSGRQAALRGIFVVAGCVGSYFLLESARWSLLALWLTIAAVDIVLEGVMYFRLAKQKPDLFITGIERQLVKFLLLIGVVGLALTAGIAYRQCVWLGPGIWMMLIGLAYVAVGLLSFSRTWILGLATCMGGAAARFVEPVATLAILAITLGGGSFIWAVVADRVESDLD